MNQTSFCGYEVPRDAAKQREAKRHVQSAFACRKDDPLPSDDTLIQLTSRPISPFCGSLEGTALSCVPLMMPDEKLHTVFFGCRLMS